MAMVTTILLWFSVLSVGLMAGVYFTFSAFGMAALGSIDRAAGIAAMNAINVVIVRSLFLPLFFGSSASCLALAVIGALAWGAAGAAAMAVGGALYFAGMFLVTIARNVPLNNALAAADPASDDGARIWADYLTRWTRWNHIRTLASTLSLALLVLAMVQRAA
ncbi:anthrone oxygenase family protein [Parasphingopyxis marina]|uniref:DUF1772 domain-containing protein n=1 Tax=Parasphingopyxis marina TaxID=2761622 RepID=A0A842HY06_9SPHN|nr:anthrone oxygenase family protein [Parasphingopyxis marina]MBC2776384.1 DUF1772 domain-containing protein [Parasphingopyxis marina]